MMRSPFCFVRLLCLTVIHHVIAYKPHILFIVMDDLGSHDLGIHGTGIRTPTIDNLIRHGVYLNNYYVLPSCSPTRAALMTGRYPSRTGIYYPLPPQLTYGLDLGEELLPEVLRTANYTAHAVGKWHLGHASYNQTPTFRGFESFYGFYYGAEDYFTHRIGFATPPLYDLRSDKGYFCGEGCSELVDERGNYSTHVFTREAMRVVREYSSTHKNPAERQEEPLFLYLAYQAVHGPDEVPDYYSYPYRNHFHWSDIRKTYAGMLTAGDEGIKNVTNTLKEMGLWEDTLVVFTTDNGGPTDRCAVQGSSNFPKRGGKCTIWQGGTTGDAFVSGGALPKLRIPRGTLLQGLFHAVDWLPTLASIVGVNRSGTLPLDGVDQLHSLQDTFEATRDELFIGYGFGGGNHTWTGPAIRHHHHKLIMKGSTKLPPDQQFFNSSAALYELYNIDKDPSETTDISQKYPFLVQALVKKLEQYVKEVAPIPSTDPTCPFHPTNTDVFGPSFVPWCDGAKEVVVYK